MNLHQSEIIHLEVINDFMITVGTDNKMVKFDLIKNERAATYKAKFFISSIKILIPSENEPDAFELPNRTNKESEVKIIVASVNGYVEILDLDL